MRLCCIVITIARDTGSDEPAVEAQSIEHAFFQEGIVILNQVSRGIGEHKGAALALIETAS